MKFVIAVQLSVFVAEGVHTMLIAKAEVYVIKIPEDVTRAEK